MRSTRQLHEELAWHSAQLEAARDLKHAAEERHSDEDMAETEAALEGRREEVLGLRERRTRLLKELDRRPDGYGASSAHKSEEERRREEREAQRRYEETLGDVSREVSSEEVSGEMPDREANP